MYGKLAAKKLGITTSDYISGILIAEMKTGTVKKNIEKGIRTHNILWAVFPKADEIYKTPKD